MAKKLLVSKEEVNQGHIKLLFKELGEIIYRDKLELSNTIEDLEEEYSKLESELLQNSKLKSLNKKIDDARKDGKRKQQSLSSRLTKIRRKFYLDGPTLPVMNSLRKLLEEVDGKLE